MAQVGTKKARKKPKGAVRRFSPTRVGTRRGPTCIDLFAGAGGLAEGFRQAGWSILAANDIDVYAGETFRLNFPESFFFQGSISSLNPARLLRNTNLKRGELDCLIGGPPCQSFSYNNHQRSAKDVRARLFRDYLRVVRALLPKTLVMENVPGMVTISKGRIVEEIKRELGKLGYQTEIRILYAEDFGVPQTRRRAFIVATRFKNVEELLPRGTHGPSEKPSEESNALIHRWKPGRKRALPFVNVWDAISDLPRLGNGDGERVTSHTKDTRTAYQRTMRAKSRKLFDHVTSNLSRQILKRISHVSEGGNWRQIPRKLLPAGMKRAELSDHTKRYGRLRRKGLSSTILTKCDPHWGAYVHPTQDRTISLREAARLQGFPDRFRFAGTYISKHYEQVGNAVPVPLAKAIAKAVHAHLKKQSEKNSQPKKQKQPKRRSKPSNAIRLKTKRTRYRRRVLIRAKMRRTRRTRRIALLKRKGSRKFAA